jgi:Tol biopolymer transport system component
MRSTGTAARAALRAFGGIALSWAALPVAVAAGTTELVSVTAGGTQAAGDSNLRHGGGALSADGRYVAFYSFRPSLVGNDRNALPDVFLRDRERDVTVLVSAATTGGTAHGWSGLPSISDDGRYVSFVSFAGDLVARDVNGAADVFVWDRDTGRAELASVGSGGVHADDSSLESALSADGRYVAFTSFAGNLGTRDPYGYTHIYLHDRQGGATERVSITADGGPANGYSWQPSVSGDGRYVAFYSGADDLVTGDRAGWADVFVRDRQTGQTLRASVSSSGTEANGTSNEPVLSAGGRYVAFVSDADNLVAGDTNQRIDVFVHDLQERTTERVSVASDGRQANGASYEPAISADGRYVAFESFANNLVPGDTNQRFDVFVHDRALHRTFRASVSTAGAQANDDSYTPSLSADGRTVAFRSDATNLAAGDANASSDVYVHALAAAGTVEEAFTVKPGVLDFGAQGVGTHRTERFWLRNHGTEALSIRGMTLRGADAASFAVAHGCGASVAAGAGCAIRVTFTPTSAGAKDATLRVEAGDDAMRTRPLAGVGVP